MLDIQFEVTGSRTLQIGYGFLEQIVYFTADGTDYKADLYFNDTWSFELYINGLEVQAPEAWYDNATDETERSWNIQELFAELSGEGLQLEGIEYNA